MIDSESSLNYSQFGMGVVLLFAASMSAFIGNSHDWIHHTG